MCALSREYIFNAGTFQHVIEVFYVLAYNEIVPNLNSEENFGKEKNYHCRDHFNSPSPSSTATRRPLAATGTS